MEVCIIVRERKSIMRKAVFSIYITMICLVASVTLMLTACSFKHPITKFKEIMNKADSYQMKIKMSNVPLVGEVSMLVKVDGNIEYTPETVFSEEKYVETVDGVEYVYTKDETGNWKKSEEKDSSTFSFSESSREQFFNPDNYVKVKNEKNTYKQKPDVVFEEFEDVVFKIKDHSYIIEMIAEIDGIKADTTIIFSKINEIELVLPKANETTEENKEIEPVLPKASETTEENKEIVASYKQYDFNGDAFPEGYEPTIHLYSDGTFIFKYNFSEGMDEYTGKWTSSTKSPTIDYYFEIEAPQHSLGVDFHLYQNESHAYGEFFSTYEDGTFGMTCTGEIFTIYVP